MATPPPAIPLDIEEQKRRYVADVTSRLGFTEEDARARADKLAEEGTLAGMDLPPVKGQEPPPAPATKGQKPPTPAPAAKKVPGPVPALATPSPVPTPAAPRDLRVREMLDAIRQAPYRNPEVVIGQHARSLGLNPEEYVRLGVEQDIDVLDYARRVREGEDVDALVRGAAERGVAAVEAPEIRGIRERGRKTAREAIRQLVDPTSKVSLKLTSEERQRRIRAIQMQMLPALKITVGPEEKEVEAALKAEGEEPGRIRLTGEQLKAAAGFQESEKFAAMGGTAEEDVEEVVRGAEAGAVAARHVIEQKLQGSPILQRLDEFDDRRFGSLSFVHGRVDELAKQRGLTDASAKAEGKDYELERKKLAVEAIRDLAMARTAGLWTGPMFLPRELHVDGNEPLWTQLQTAFTPNLEVLGLDEKGDVVFRQESPWEYIFGLLDVPLAATVGVVGGLARGEVEGAPFTPTLARSVAEAALRGVGERESFSGLAMESPAAQAGAAGALALGAGGLVLDVLFPLDVPVVAAKGAARLKLGAKAEKLATTVARRSAATLLEEARDSSLTAVAAWRQGKTDEALALWDAGAKAEGRLREEFKAADMGESLDRANAEFASRTGAGMGFTNAARALPGDLGVDRVGAHMAERRQVLERRTGKKVTTTVAQPGLEQYNPALSLRRLEEVRTKIIPLAAEQAARRTAAVARVTRAVQDPDRAARAARVVEQGAQRRARSGFVTIFPTPSLLVTDEMARLTREVGRSLGDVARQDPDAVKMLTELGTARSQSLLWKDPWAWFASWRDRRGDPEAWTELFDQAGAAAAEDAPRKRKRYDFIKSLLRVRDAAIRAGDPEQMLALVDRARENLVLVSESRALAAHVLADMVRKGLTKGDPEELRRMREEEIARRGVRKKAAPTPPRPLSPRAENFAPVAKRMFRLSDEQAGAWARVMDARAEAAVASGADASVDVWWQAQGLEFRRAMAGEKPNPAALLARAMEEADDVAKTTGLGADERAVVLAWKRKLEAFNRDFYLAQKEANEAQGAAQMAGDVTAARAAEKEMARINSEWMPKLEKLLAERSERTKRLFATAPGGEPKASILFREGRAIITAFEKGDISSIVHETGHLFRRDMERAAAKLGAESPSARDLAALAEWAGAEATTPGGIPVWTVDAEEKIALAFERYLRDGKAPVEHLRRVFAQFREFLRRIYAKLKGSPIEEKLSDDVRGVFDRMLGGAEAEAPPPGGPGGRLPPKGPEPPEPPAPPSPEARLAEAERAIRATPLPVVSKAHAVGEQTFTESLRNVLEGPGKLRAAVRMAGIGTMFGGDAWRALRELPIRVRDSVMAGVRTAEHGINDAVALTREAASAKDPATLLRFLDGEQVTFRDGRAVPSSGWSAAQSVARHVRQAWDSMSEEAQDLLLPLLREEPINLNALPADQRAAIDRAVAAFTHGTLLATQDVPPLRFMQDLSQSLERLPKAEPGASRVITPKEFELVRGVLRWAGVSPKPLDDVIEAAEDIAEDVLPDIRAETLLDLVGRLYGAGDRARTAVLLAAHGHAERARMLWTGLLPGLGGDTLGVSKGAAQAFQAWVLGKRVPPNRIPQVQLLAARFGINPHFVDEPLLGGKIFLPTQARKMLAQAVSRGVERFDPRFSWDEAQAAGFMPAMLRYVKLRMTRGAVFIRPRYYLMNTFDHFNQLSIQPGVGVGAALASTLRILPQTMFAVVPGGARLFYAAQRATEAAVRLGAKAPSPLGEVVLGRGNVERFRAMLQLGGDRAARAVQKLLGGAKYHVSVNDVLDGGAAARARGESDRIVLGTGKYAREYTFAELREIAVQAGIFASYDVSQLSNVIRGEIVAEAERLRWSLPRKAWGTAKDALQDFMGFTTEMGEAWSERERLGTMVTLIESGMSPKDAARLTVRALYDYSGSMTAADRHLLVSLFLPFWAYHKNANQQVMNSMMSPKGAWVSGVIRRAHLLGPQYLSDAVYFATIDPYGVDVDALSTEGQASYWTLRHLVENGMGDSASWPAGIREQLEAKYGPVEEWSEDARDFAVNGYKGYDNVPPDVRAAMRAIFAAEKNVIRQGSLYELGTWAQAVHQMQTQPGAVPPPDPSARRRYYRSAGGITIPIPPSTSDWVKWYYADATKDYPYTEMFLPESTIVAGMRHVSGALATWALMGQFLVEETGAFDPVDPRTKVEAEAGMAPVRLRNALYEVIEPGRAPIAREMFSMLGQQDAPRKVHPVVARLIQDILPLSLEPKMETMDPNAPPAAQVTEEKRYYLPPGAASLAYELTPGLAEMNQILLALDKAPLEERAKLTGDLLVAARMVGFQTVESSYERTFKAERPRFQISTPSPRATAPAPE